MTPAQIVIDAVTKQCDGLKDEVALENRLKDRLADDLNLDSLDVVEIVMTIEDKLGIVMENVDLSKVKTVQDLINCTEALVKGVGV